MSASRAAAIFLIALACLFGRAAQAQISVSEMVVDVPPDRPLHDLVVGNVGDDIASVQVEVIEILDPGTPEQSFVEG